MRTELSDRECLMIRWAEVDADAPAASDLPLARLEAIVEAVEARYEAMLRAEGRWRPRPTGNLRSAGNPEN